LMVLAAVAAAIAMLAIGSASASSHGAFSDGGFEAAEPGASGSPWVVGGGGINWIAAGITWSTPDASAHIIDLNEDDVAVDGGAAGSAGGSVTQTFDTVPGINYDVEFSRSGNPACLSHFGNVQEKTLEVWLDGTFLFDDDFTPATTVFANLAWVPHFFTFTAGAGPTTELKFLSLNEGACGPLLDAVSVTGPTTDTDGDGVDDDEDAFINSNEDPTVAIGGCESGVANVQVGGGANMNDLIGAAAAEATNHGAFVKAVSKLANEWKKDGLISGKEKGKITSCAARSDVGK